MPRAADGLVGFNLGRGARRVAALAVATALRRATRVRADARVLRGASGPTRPTTPSRGAWERRRALLLAEAQPGERVLDLGCGAGRFLAALRDAGADPVGVEIAEAALERARATCPAPTCACSSPTARSRSATASVDLVWCSEVLEHVPDARARCCTRRAAC